MAIIKVLRCSCSNFKGRLFMAKRHETHGWFILTPSGERVKHPRHGYKMGWLHDCYVEIIQE